MTRGANSPARRDSNRSDEPRDQQPRREGNRAEEGRDRNRVAPSRDRGNRDDRGGERRPRVANDISANDDRDEEGTIPLAALPPAIGRIDIGSDEGETFPEAAEAESSQASPRPPSAPGRGCRISAQPQRIRRARVIPGPFFFARKLLESRPLRADLGGLKRHPGLGPGEGKNAPVIIMLLITLDSMLSLFNIECVIHDMIRNGDAQ